MIHLLSGQFVTDEPFEKITSQRTALCHLIGFSQRRSSRLVCASASWGWTFKGAQHPLKCTGLLGIISYVLFNICFDHKLSEPKLACQCVLQHRAQ